MLLRRVSLFVLVAFALWATGIARWAHEELDHHASEHAAQIAQAADGSSGVEATELSHDDCVICQMLAVMTVNRPPPAPMPSAPAAPTPEKCFNLPDLPYACHVAWLLPSRGPPAPDFSIVA